MNKETEKKIQQLQLIEQNLHNIIMQKQAFQMQLAEDENAMKELDKTSKNAYKIIGTIMVSSSREELKKELKEQKDILDLRIKSLEKEENSVPRNIRSKVDTVISEIGNNNCEFDIKISRLLNDLEEISEDPNLPSYIRSEILMAIGLLSEL